LIGNVFAFGANQLVVSGITLILMVIFLLVANIEKYNTYITGTRERNS
jgi:hypothetical protein